MSLRRLLQALLLLPFSYHINSHPLRFPDLPRAAAGAPEAAPGPARDAARAAAGLPAAPGGKLFCSYNQFFKVTVAAAPRRTRHSERCAALTGFDRRWLHPLVKPAGQTRWSNQLVQTR